MQELAYSMLVTNVSPGDTLVVEGVLPDSGKQVYVHVTATSSATVHDGEVRGYHISTSELPGCGPLFTRASKVITRDDLWNFSLNGQEMSMIVKKFDHVSS